MLLSPPAMEHSTHPVCRVALLGLLLLGLTATRLCGQLIAYAVPTDGKLYSVDLSTQTATLLGSPSSGSLEGLAMSPTGQLYGTDSSGVLYSFDLLTGAATPIGSTGRGNIEGLDFSGSVLLGIDFSSTPTVFSIDLNTGASTTLVTLGSATGSVRTMTVVDANTILIRSDSPVTNSLQSVNLTTGAVTLIGTLNVSGSQFAAMDFAANGNLYGLDNNGGVLLINPATAATTLLGSTGSQFWLDMAFVTVPEPSTYALLVGGGAWLAWMRRRRAA
jgi:hypothetical protein